MSASQDNDHDFSDLPATAEDLEEYQLGSGFEEQNQLVDKWEETQRELVTSVLNYNLGSISSLIADGKIDLSPGYQRRLRWDPPRQSKLIESFLMNVPVPPIFLNEDDYGTYSVIDGKQRLTSISDFLNDRYALKGLDIFSQINGKYFKELPPEIQSVLLTRATVQTIIILRQSSPEIKFEVFDRLNTGGIKLNAQEIRNSTWPGPFNDMILALSEDSDFHNLLRIREKRRSAIWKNMRDAEFVLRYFAFRENWQTFNGGMKRWMDKSMIENQRPTPAAIDQLEVEFRQTVAAVKAGFGEFAFRRWDPSRKAWNSAVLASLFDAQMFACRHRDPAKLRQKSDEIIEGLKSLFNDDDFRKSIDAATNTPALFRSRITSIIDLLDEA